MAERATNFAGQFMRNALFGRIVPLQVMMTMQEIDVLLVEDSRPLERCRVLRLAGCAVTQLAI